MRDDALCGGRLALSGPYVAGWHTASDPLDAGGALAARRTALRRAVPPGRPERRETMQADNPVRARDMMPSRIKGKTRTYT